MTGDVPIIFLAGGKGTRLRELASDLPKPMISVRGKPFLHWLVAYYRDAGFRSFLFSTGHMAEVIENYEWSRSFPNARFDFYRESKPLGTGGAAQAIFAHRGLERAWIVNGDTLLPTVLPDVPERCEAFYTVLEEGEVFDASPNVATAGEWVDCDAEPTYFDAGAIFVRRAAIERYAGPIPCSIHELLAPAITARRVGYAIVPGTCYDIGTPERYRRFEKYLESREDAPR